MNKLTVKYSLGNAEGCIELYVKAFFPCTKKKLKVLIPLMVQTEKDVIEDLIQTLQDMCKECEQVCETSARLFHITHQKMVDHQQMISSGKRMNGIPLTKDELEGMKSNVKRYEKEKKSHQKRFMEHHTKQKKLSQNIEMLGQLL